MHCNTVGPQAGKILLDGSGTGGCLLVLLAFSAFWQEWLLSERRPKNFSLKLRPNGGNKQETSRWVLMQPEKAKSAYPKQDNLFPIAEGAVYL